MTTRPKTRPATPADLPAIAALHAANWRRDYADVLSVRALGQPLVDRIARLWGQGGALDTGWQVRLVPGEESEVAGFVLFRAEGEAVHVGALHVALDHRGRGIGAALMGDVAHAARALPVWLEVLSGNAPARAIYRHWGGREGVPYGELFLGDPVRTLQVTWPSGATLSARLKVMARS